MQNNRVMVFIDGSNFEIARKKCFGNRMLDYNKFINKLCGDRRLIKAFYFEAPLLKIVNASSYEGQQGFFKYLRALPYFDVQLGHRVKRENKFFCKDCSKTILETAYEQKGVDSLIVLNLMSLAVRNAYDIALLVSGDQDFANALIEVKMLDKIVENAFLEIDWAPNLARVADKTIKLDADYMKDCWKTP